MSCGSKLRAVDLLGVPISLLYKGESTFTTRVGGLLSILWVIIVILGFIQESIYLLVQGNGVETEVTTVYDYYDESNDRVDTLDSNYSVMANLNQFLTWSGTPSYDVDQIVRIQFFGSSLVRQGDGSLKRELFWT